MWAPAAAAAAWVGMIAAQQASDSTGIPYFNQGIVGVSVVGILLLFWKVQRSIINPMQDRISRSEHRERVCEWRLSLVVEALAHDRPVPQDVMWRRPPWDNGHGDEP